jgi:hypothetical protein
MRRNNRLCGVSPVNVRRFQTPATGEASIGRPSGPPACDAVPESMIDGTPSALHLEGKVDHSIRSKCGHGRLSKRAESPGLHDLAVRLERHVAAPAKSWAASRCLRTHIKRAGTRIAFSGRLVFRS